MREKTNLTWRTPIFSNLLLERGMCLGVVGSGVVHLGLSLAGLPSWNCPILAATGVPCPGCGLTRASMALIRGDFLQSLQIHAFAPIVMFAMLLTSVTLALPDTKRDVMIEKISRFENASGVATWALFSLMLYWAFRLIA